MTAVGGSIERVTLNGRIFAVAADGDSNRDLGGFSNEVQSNGDGSARLIKTRKPMMFDSLVLEVDDTREDQEFIQDLANAKDFFPATVTYASGAVYEGQAQITGDIQTASQAQTMTINLSGPFSATVQSFAI